MIDNAVSIVPEFEEDVFWTYYLSNPALRDGVAMYHADHGNKAAAGGAISVVTVGAGRKALRTMKAADGKRTIKMKLVVTEAITGKRWDLLVEPSKRSHNMKRGYLRDRSAPRVRVDEPFGVQGMRMTLEHDFGVGGVNSKGGYSNVGQ